MKFSTFSKLLIVTFVISLILKFFCIIKWSDLLNITVLSLTAWVVAMQSFATEKMVKYDVVPAIVGKYDL